MSYLSITGGLPLRGEIAVHGAKNSALPILAASLLCPGVSVIRNCPPLSDVLATLAILEHLGCRVTRTGHTVTVDASCLSCTDVPDRLGREMRSSVLFLGALLGRTGQCTLCYPGGCELGPRPIDLHLSAMRRLGACTEETPEGLVCTATRLTGQEIILPFPSVGATENAMLAAVAARGVTSIVNAAREPEIGDLQQFLNTAGAEIRGAGTSVVTITGGRPLHGGSYTVPGDRIVAATYLSAAAATGGSLELLGVDGRRLSTVTSVLSEAGCRLRKEGRRICLHTDRPLTAVSPIRTGPYPGFPTDAQAPLMAGLCTARGTTLFVETVFSSRYRHVDELRRMGADIRTEGAVAVLTGVPTLRGASVRAHDLRGGAALLIGALSAEGDSRVEGLSHLDRGYYAPERDLQALGARIQRIC